MKLHDNFWLLSFGLLANALALDKREEDEINNNVVGLEFKAIHGAKHPNPRYAPYHAAFSLDTPARLQKRGGGYQLVTLTNQFTYYEIDVEIGTPGQQFGQVLDTGSSDLWVGSSDNPYCSNAVDSDIPSADQISCDSGTFNLNDSSTWLYNVSSTKSSPNYRNANVSFSIAYQDGSFAAGIWGTDVVSIGNFTLKNCSVAVGLEANSSQGVLGVGLPALESTNSVQSGLQSGKQQAFIYQNVPQLMKTQGLIKAVAYSLWLNDVNSDSGQILFGGVDHAKYSGTLWTVPLINNHPSASKPIELTIMLNGIQLVSASGKAQTILTASTPALLDSGTTFTYLPAQVVRQLAAALSAQLLPEVGYYVTACNLGASNKTGITYNFSGANISVPLSELLIELEDESGNPATFKNGDTACALGILPSSDIILGDTFLRSAYVVYNLDTYEVSIANTNFNVTKSSIGTIDSKGVPSATKAPNYSSTKIASTITVAASVTRIGGSPESGQPSNLLSGSSAIGTQTTAAAATTTRTNEKNAGVTYGPAMPKAVAMGAGAAAMAFYI